MPAEVDAAVIDAAQRAGAHEMILRLPQGYDTPLPIRESGGLLAGGIVTAGQPILTGIVHTVVSADSVRDERTGLSHFTAIIVVPDDQVALLRTIRGSDTGIRPGVPVQVTVTLKKRSALQYMLSPLTEGLSRSFSER